MLHESDQNVSSSENIIARDEEMDLDSENIVARADSNTNPQYIEITERKRPSDDNGAGT